MRDCVSKNRLARGTKKCRAKLTDARVRLMRALYVPHSRKFGSRALARRFGIGKSLAGDVIRGNRWKHVK